MTTFFDAKEQVLDVQLTSFGKHLLSQGNFTPEFYSFFDDDVLYDGSYANVLVESQNSIHDRIKQVPRIETQTVFHGVENEVLKNNEFVRMGERDKDGIFTRLNDKRIQNTPDKHYALSAPLGTMSLESVAAPAWSVNVLNGSISGSISFQTGSQPTLKIPELTFDNILYKTIAVDDTPPEQGGSTTVQEGENGQVGSASDLSLLIKKFPDGSFIDVVEDTIILEVEEINSIFDNENFDVEVFEIHSASSGNNLKETLIPLYFANKKRSLIQNNILLEPEEISSLNNNISLDSSCVEYFFEILTDNEIDADLLCRLNANNKTGDSLTGRILDCKLVKQPEQDLYTSDVIEKPSDCK